MDHTLYLSIKVTDYIKNPHAATLNGPTSWRNCHLGLNLIVKEYSQYHDYIIIICPELRWNKSHDAKRWKKCDGKVWFMESKDRLYQ